MKATTITFNKNTLTNAVAKATNYVSKDNEYAGQLVLKANDGILEILATNYNETVHLKNISFVSSDLPTDSFDTFAIDGKKLLTVLKTSKADEVSIELHKNFVNIIGPRSRVKVETVAKVQDIPLLSYENTLELNETLLDGFNKVLHSVDVNNSKFELNGALLQVHESSMSLISTDTQRLSVVFTDTQAKDMEIIIPRHAIQSIMKLFQTDLISAEYGDSDLSIHTDNISYSTKLINGKFPDWRRIMPKDKLQTISIEKNMLTELVQEASIFEESLIVDIRAGEITICDSSNNTVVKDSIDSEATMRFGMNSKFILEFLNASHDDYIQLDFNGASMPVSLISNDNYRDICMPLFLDEEEEVQAAA